MRKCSHLLLALTMFLSSCSTCCFSCSNCHNGTKTQPELTRTRLTLVRWCSSMTSASCACLTCLQWPTQRGSTVMCRCRSARLMQYVSTWNYRHDFKQCCIVRCFVRLRKISTYDIYNWSWKWQIISWIVKKSRLVLYK